MTDFSLNLLPSDTTMHPPNHKSSFTFFSRPDESSETTTSTYAAANATDHMFEKSLTPSDVGKLNRLVIPKQHAEKYFPPAAATTAGGILLAFQDECGKCWRFRYSYWNSSQSYVLTKGWSRYVKDKKLDAGDVVLFERHRFEPDRFFIGWRRRGTAPQPPPNQRSTSSLYNAVQQGYPAPQEHRITAGSFQYLPSDCFHAGTEVRQQQIMSQKPASVNPKRLRLFGVNLECQLEVDEDTEPQTSDGSSLSSQGTGSGPYSVSGSGAMSYNYFEYMGYPPNHHNHMDMNYPQDVNQMRN